MGASGSKTLTPEKTPKDDKVSFCQVLAEETEFGAVDNAQKIISLLGLRKTVRRGDHLEMVCRFLSEHGFSFTEFEPFRTSTSLFTPKYGKRHLFYDNSHPKGPAVAFVPGLAAAAPYILQTEIKSPKKRLSFPSSYDETQRQIIASIKTTVANLEAHEPRIVIVVPSFQSAREIFISAAHEGDIEALGLLRGLVAGADNPDAPIPLFAALAFLLGSNSAATLREFRLGHHFSKKFTEFPFRSLLAFQQTRNLYIQSKFERIENLFTGFGLANSPCAAFIVAAGLLDRAAVSELIDGYGLRFNDLEPALNPVIDAVTSPYNTVFVKHRKRVANFLKWLGSSLSADLLEFRFNSTDPPSALTIDALLDAGYALKDEYIFPYIETSRLHRANGATSKSLQLLLKRGANPNAINPKGGNPAIFLAKNADHLAILLEAGADPNARNKRGKTVLELALENEDLLKISALRSFGQFHQPDSFKCKREIEEAFRVKMEGLVADGKVASVKRALWASLLWSFNVDRVLSFWLGKYIESTFSPSHEWWINFFSMWDRNEQYTPAFSSCSGVLDKLCAEVDIDNREGRFVGMRKFERFIQRHLKALSTFSEREWLTRAIREFYPIVNAIYQTLLNSALVFNDAQPREFWRGMTLSKTRSEMRALKVGDVLAQIAAPTSTTIRPNVAKAFIESSGTHTRILCKITIDVPVPLFPIMFCSNFVFESEVLLLGKGHLEIIESPKVILPVTNNAWRISARFVPTGELPPSLPLVPPNL